MITKRGQVMILVVATILVFVGLVWMIATKLPWNQTSYSSPSNTAVTSRMDDNCTYPVSYWRLHTELYPLQITIGGEVYQAGDIRAILSSEDTDLQNQLQKQLIGAFLNTLSGASQTSIEPEIFQAYDWLVSHRGVTQLSNDERDTASKLIKSIEAYNLGLVGVPPCQAGATLQLTVTPTSTRTQAISVTITSSKSPTITPSVSPSQISQSATGTQTAFVPSQTPKPPTEGPGSPSSTPPRTLSPSLTSAPTKTTEAPTSTRTASPLFTNTPIKTTEPPPTATLTITIAPSATRTLVPSPTKTPVKTTEAASPTPTKTALPPNTPTSTIAPSQTSTVTPPVPTPTNPPQP